MCEVFCVITLSAHTFSACTAAAILWILFKPGDASFCTRYVTIARLNIYVTVYKEDAHCVYIKKKNCIMLFREIIAVYFANV
jgi:hypothetical protein